MVHNEDEHEGGHEGEEVPVLRGRSTCPPEGHQVDLQDDRMGDYLVGHPGGHLVGLLPPECALFLTVKEHRTYSRWPSGGSKNKVFWMRE